MNYEFHVGDYVETWSGVSGHISKFEKWRHPDFIEDSVWFVYTTKKGNSYYFESEVSQLKYEFRRIGAYDFTKKEKKKIEPISDCNKHIFANAIKSDNHLIRMVSGDILNKINELVDAVNLLLDKSTED